MHLKKNNTSHVMKTDAGSAVLQGSMDSNNEKNAAYTAKDAWQLRVATATKVFESITADETLGLGVPQDMLTYEADRRTPQHSASCITDGESTPVFLSRVATSSWSCGLRALALGLLGSESHYGALGFPASKCILDWVTVVIGAEAVPFIVHRSSMC